MISLFLLTIIAIFVKETTSQCVFTKDNVKFLLHPRLAHKNKEYEVRQGLDPCFTAMQAPYSSPKKKLSSAKTFISTISKKKNGCTKIVARWIYDVLKSHESKKDAGQAWYSYANSYKATLFPLYRYQYDIPNIEQTLDALPQKHFDNMKDYPTNKDLTTELLKKLNIPDRTANEQLETEMGEVIKYLKESAGLFVYQVPSNTWTWENSQYTAADWGTDTAKEAELVEDNEFLLEYKDIYERSRADDKEMWFRDMLFYSQHQIKWYELLMKKIGVDPFTAEKWVRDAQNKDKGNAFFKSWKATPADIVALTYYTDKHGGCTPLVRTFRWATKKNQHDFMVWHYAIIGAFQRWTAAANIKNSAASKFKMKSSTVVYRGLAGVCIDFFRDMLMAGAKTHAGPMSTSVDQKVMNTFGNKPSGGIGIEFKHEPKQSEWQPVPAFEFSLVPEEKEWLMYAGSLSIQKLHFYPGKATVSKKEAMKCVGNMKANKKCGLRYGDPTWEGKCKTLLGVNNARVGYQNSMIMDEDDESDMDYGASDFGYIDNERYYDERTFNGMYHDYHPQYVDDGVSDKVFVDNDPKILVFMISMLVLLCICCLCGLGVGCVIPVVFMKGDKIISKIISGNGGSYETEREIP